MSFANESNWDRILRVVIGLVIVGLGWSGVISGVLGTVVIIVGFILLITGLVGFCPLYALLHFRTKKV